MIIAIVALVVLGVVGFLVYSTSDAGSELRGFAKWITAYSFSAAIMFVLLALATPVAAQDDSQLYVCRTDRQDLVEIQVHNYQETLGPDFWVLGDAWAPDGEVLVIQALTNYQPIAGCQDCIDQVNFIQNGMAIAGNQDYSIEIVGTPDTPLCGQGKWTVTMSGTDFSQLPDQSQEGVLYQGCPPGQVLAVNRSTGAYLLTSLGLTYCTSSLTSVVGIPPAGGS